MDESLYVGADEAAGMLGVSIGTLYVYVSRKGLRSFPTEGSRRRRYWRADIDALRRKADFNPTAGFQGLVRSTSLTLLTDAGLFYRGTDATVLAESASLEDAASLLWNVERSVFDDPPSPGPQQLSMLFAAMKKLTKVELAQALLPVIENGSPRAYDLSPSGFASTSAAVLRWLAAIVSGATSASSQPIHLVIARAHNPDGRYDDLVRRALVLAADHELDPTTYAVRSAANTGVTPYGAVMVGLAVSRGQRLLNKRALHTARFLKEVLNSTDPAIEVLRLIRAGEPIPGFSTIDVHRGHDPRASALLEAMRDQLAENPQLRKLEGAIRVAEEVTGVTAQFILPITFLGLQIGHDDEPLTFSSLGRAVGWLAHAQEQYLSGDLIRPRTAYVGLLPEARERT